MSGVARLGIRPAGVGRLCQAGGMPGIYSHQRFCELASDEIARLAAAVDGADPATPVPTCGRWAMADLVQHVGHIHRWAGAMVADLSPTRHSRGEADLPLPADPATWPAWLAEAQTTLIPALRAADPDARMWAWGPDKHARFWSRRMVQGDAAAPTVTVRAPTADLHLFLWGRRRPGHPGLTVTGDAALLTHGQRHAVI
jgi:hypothetical protein